LGDRLVLDHQPGVLNSLVGTSAPDNTINLKLDSVSRFFLDEDTGFVCCIFKIQLKKIDKLENTRFRI
jgi:hypothetical protein